LNEAKEIKKDEEIRKMKREHQKQLLLIMQEKERLAQEAELNQLKMFETPRFAG
jgi:uncharacterized Zn finger protein